MVPDFEFSLAAAKSYPTLAGLRLLVGAGEALGQGLVFYLSLWYKKDELVTRLAVFFSMSAVASSLSGLIAYGVLKHMAHAHGIAAWQWLFIIEGTYPRKRADSSACLSC